MLIRLIIIPITLFLFASSANASNCGLDKLDFGITQQQLKSKYNLESLDVTTSGEATINSGAAEICKDLPEDAVVGFMLIDDKFVQMQIVNKNINGALFDYATRIFGERDNKPKNLKKPIPSDKIRLGLWSKNDTYSAIYTSYMAGKYKREKLAITSKNYKDLFGKANLAKSQDRDNYLKEKKLGKYSASYKGDENVATNGDVGGIYSNNRLKDNDNSRGSHYVGE